MLIVSLLVIGILARGSDGQVANSCHDLDTNACVLFQKANPNLCSNQAYAFGACQRFCNNCPIECYDCPNPVKNASNCSTSLCAVNQTCMLKQFVGRDGQEEFIMRCEDKALCEGLLQGFYNVPVGRRSLTSSHVEEANGLFERDVSLSLLCCDTSFCNTPNPSPTTVQLTSPGLFPSGCNHDIVFALDDSGSVGSTNFRQILNFVKEIIRQLDIGPTKAQVAMLTFSNQTEINWYLNRYSTKQDLLAAVDNTSYHGEVTHTNTTLTAVREQVLMDAHGDRKMAKDVVIVLTDGQSNDRLDTIKEAQTLHSVSDDVISIAIGSGINAQEIQTIATDNHHVFVLRSYSALNTILSSLMRIICIA